MMSSAPSDPGNCGPTTVDGVSSEVPPKVPSEAPSESLSSVSTSVDSPSILNEVREKLIFALMCEKRGKLDMAENVYRSILTTIQIHGNESLEAGACIGLCRVLTSSKRNGEMLPINIRHQKLIETLSLYKRLSQLRPTSLSIYGDWSGTLLKLRRPRTALSIAYKGLEFVIPGFQHGQGDFSLKQIQSTEKSAVLALSSNANNALRMLGYQREALIRTWQILSSIYDIHPPLSSKEYISTSIEMDFVSQIKTEDSVTGKDGWRIVCVKHGTKYDSKYVNRLSAALHREAEKEGTHVSRFVCLTDDVDGLDESIVEGILFCQETSNLYQTWWCKVAIFGEKSLSESLWWLYLDIDAILTGSLTPLFSTADNWLNYSTTTEDMRKTPKLFTLSTTGLTNEARMDGINSSLILYRPIDWRWIYDFFILNHKAITATLFKFDHFLETMLWPNGQGAPPDRYSSFKTSDKCNNSCNLSPEAILEEESFINDEIDSRIILENTCYIKEKETPIEYGGVVFVQNLFRWANKDPVITDYHALKNDCLVSTDLRERFSGLVCFPLRPKPHELENTNDEVDTTLYQIWTMDQ